MKTRTIRFELAETEMEELRKLAARQVRRPNEQAKMLVLIGLGLGVEMQEQPAEADASPPGSTTGGQSVPNTYLH